MVQAAYADSFIIFDRTRAAEPVSERWDPFSLGVEVGKVSSPPLPEPKRLTDEIKRMTGWSDRSTAMALRTTHPTVAKILDGQRIGFNLQDRIVRVNEVVRRIHLLTNEDPSATSRALRTEPAEGRESAMVLMAREEFSAAYLAAMDVQRPRPTSRFMSGDRPSTVGDATQVLLDED